MSPENTDFLYPFIDSAEHDADSLLTDLAESASAKATENSRLCRSCLETLGNDLEQVAGMIADRFRVGACLYTFGNGGSATDAASTAALFSRSPGHTGLAARCLVADQAVLTAIGNDVGYELTFSRQLIAFAQPRDIAIGYSTSGNSANVVLAFEEAKRRGLLTVGLAGYEGGHMAASDAVDHCFVVPSHSVHRIQEAQAALSYLLWESVHTKLASSRAPASAGRWQMVVGQASTEPEEAR